MGEADRAICEQEFVAENVGAEATIPAGRPPLGSEMGYVCPSRIEYMGQHPSGQFPTIEEYGVALKAYPEPVWTSEEALKREDPKWEYTDEAGQLTGSR